MPLFFQAAHEDAFYVQVDCLGKSHPDVATSLANLAALATRRGDLAQARHASPRPPMPRDAMRCQAPGLTRVS